MPSANTPLFNQQCTEELPTWNACLFKEGGFPSKSCDLYFVCTHKSSNGSRNLPRPICQRDTNYNTNASELDPFTRLETVKKGLILELHTVLKSNLITWATFSKWVQMIFKSERPEQWALRKLVTALSTCCCKMQKNYRCKSELEKLLNEPYALPQRHRSESNRPMKATASVLSLHCVGIWHW